ncbi:cobalt ABC transporter [Arthrospira sp. O9.13F]|nr:cobalt ABC transporter [Arthrospira sp. O9.13F]
MNRSHWESDCSIRVENLTFSYAGEKPIWREISFSLNPGERLGLHGTTGTGKSTLMETLIGLKTPNSGKIWIQGTLVEPSSLRQIRRQIGFGFQDPNDQLFMPTIFEDVMFGPCNYGVSNEQASEIAHQLLAQFGLAKLAHRSVHELSGGQKRLATLAAILALNPTILILDEPTNGLDPWWRRNLAEILVNLPIEVLLIASHDLQWVSRVTERSLILGDGKIQVDRPTKELLQDRDTLEKCGLPDNWA